MGRPSQIGQEELLRSAYRNSGLSGGAVDYVEAHGTGTRAGDPVEFGALAAVLGEGREPQRQAFVGSLKTNLGHTEATAGVASLIKTALALHHNAIPPSLHHKTPDAADPLGRAAIGGTTLPRVLAKTQWSARRRRERVRYRGYQRPHRARRGTCRGCATNMVLTRSPVPLPLSAKNPEALRMLAAGCRRSARVSTACPNLYDVCWTAATRRTSLEHRAVFVADDRASMAESLRRYAQEEAAAVQGVVNSDAKPRVCFHMPWAGRSMGWYGPPADGE